MSLINDALKRTKDVQQQAAPAASGPALRPVDPAQAKTASSARSFLFIMVAAVVVGNLLLWLAFHEKPANKSAEPMAGEAITTPVAPKPVAVTPEPTVPEPTPVVPAPAAVAVVEPEAVPTNAPEAAPKVVFVEPERPTVLRLQSIIYGSRPSAMIGGKFLFVGDSIQGHKVIAIAKETVTLVGEGQTNILRLP